MYTIAKTVARDKLRLNPALLTPMQRLWRIAYDVSVSSSKYDGPKRTHEV